MNHTQPILLGDIFDRTFKLIGKTFTRIITIGAILIIPGSIILILGLDWFYSTLAEFIQLEQTKSEIGIEQGMKMLAGVFIILPGVIIFTVAATGAKIAAISIVCNEITEKNISWKEALTQSFQKKVWRALGQVILEYVVYAGLFFVVGIVLAIVIAASLGYGMLLGFMLFFIVIGVIIYCSIRWFLTLQVIVWEDSRVMNSFSRSWTLVGDHWWRTFGIIFLFTLLLGFAESLITTPLMFMTMWNSYASFFQAVGVSGGENVDPAIVAQMLSSLGFAIGIIVVFSTIFRLLIEPAYRSVMYFDLRSRHGEFTEHESSRPFASYFQQPQQ
jgi:hypothetical protein